MTGNRLTDGRVLARLNAIYLLLMLLVLAGILTTAMIFQYAQGEIPCPLCLLQRVAMFGVCFGIVRSLRYGFSFRDTGIGMLFAMVLLVISVRQTLIDIYPRPGHEYIGSAVFGLHMPVWSVVIATALLLAFALQLVAVGGSADPRDNTLAASPAGKLAAFASLYVIALCAINFVSVVVQCGFGQCHTFGYRLLG